MSVRRIAAGLGVAFALMLASTNPGACGIGQYRSGKRWKLPDRWSQQHSRGMLLPFYPVGP
jgi:hypothetical protein